MAIAILVLSLIGLWLGTDMTIRGAVNIAARLGLPEFIVGVTIVSVGSDLPELTVAVSGAIQNLKGGDPASDIITGSALGSALGQIGLVMGIAGMLGTLTLTKVDVVRHGSVLIGSLLILALCGIDGTVSRTDGGILVTLYVIYLVVLFRAGNRQAIDDVRTNTPGLSWLLLVVGLSMIAVSAEFTIRTATEVASDLNIRTSTLALIVVGAGTSLPELSISIVAIFKKRIGLSVGNLIGSNIFDTLVPIGVAALISTLQFDRSLLLHDLPFLLGLSCLVLFFLVRRRGLQKFEAAVLIALYGGYALLRVAVT